MPALRVLDRSAPLAEVLEILHTDGGVVVHDLLPEGAADQIVHDLKARYAAIAPGSRSGLEVWDHFHGQNTVRFTGLAADSDAFVDHALLNPVLTGVADEVLVATGVGADYWLNTGQVMAVGPGEPAQVLHRDEGNWPEARRPDREITVSCMFALSDFTEQNGATRVVPGSHRGPGLDRNSGLTPDDTVGAVMPKGSGMIYTGKVVHGAGANQTGAARYGMHLSYVAGWLRPEEASPLMVDRVRAAQLPERARQLLGWGSYHSQGGGRTWLVDFEDAELMFRHH
ncbi:MAG: mitomycin antibiotic biosynthesis protein [Actinomycetia bacterium]|nr:mitomycin antibiotic biosynthesis protein [Actinomycetes bacterium]